MSKKSHPVHQRLTLRSTSTKCSVCQLLFSLDIRHTPPPLHQGRRWQVVIFFCSIGLCQIAGSTQSYPCHIFWWWWCFWRRKLSSRRHVLKHLDRIFKRIRKKFKGNLMFCGDYPKNVDIWFLHVVNSTFWTIILWSKTWI